MTGHMIRRGTENQFRRSTSKNILVSQKKGTEVRKGITKEIV